MSKNKYHESERESLDNEKFSWQKTSKTPPSNQFFPHFLEGFCPCGHLIDYHLPNVDNCGHFGQLPPTSFCPRSH